MGFGHPPCHQLDVALSEPKSKRLRWAAKLGEAFPSPVSKERPFRFLIQSQTNQTLALSHQQSPAPTRPALGVVEEAEVLLGLILSKKHGLSALPAVCDASATLCGRATGAWIPFSHAKPHSLRVNPSNMLKFRMTGLKRSMNPLVTLVFDRVAPLNLFLLDMLSNLVESNRLTFSPMSFPSLSESIQASIWMTSMKPAG